jgi:hypothetical protein
MADQKITELTAVSAVTTDDLVVLVDDPAGTPVTKRATAALLLDTRVIDRSRPNITVTNTATETDVYTVTIPANTLGTTGRVRLELLGAKLKNGGGADAHTMKVYYGATNIISALGLPAVSDDSTTLKSVRLIVDLSANGATNAQICHATIYSQTNNTGASAFASRRGTATEDATASKVLKVSWTQGATALHAYTSEQGIVYLV